MKSRDSLDKKPWLMALSFLVALLLWLFIAAEREGQLALNIQVETVGPGAGLVVVSPLPSHVETVIVGPRILLWRLRGDRLKIPLDMRGLGEGTASFTALDRMLHLDQELRVIRVSPASIAVSIASVSLKAN